MNARFLFVTCVAISFTIGYVPVLSQNNSSDTSRLMHASVNGTANASYYPQYNNKILVSWRMLPTDAQDTAFDLYRITNGEEKIKLNEESILLTNYQDITADRNADNKYILHYAGNTEVLDTFIMPAERASQGLPYISIPLVETASDSHLDANVIYEANDASVGHLLGINDYQIIIRRNGNDSDESDEIEEDESRMLEHLRAGSDIWSPVILEAYTLEGVYLWRIVCGPNIMNYNGVCFSVIDLDEDGYDEVIIRTSEGTVFGDGTEIGDVNGDGIIDYRTVTSSGHYINGMPEFLSVIDGRTGKELARAPYIEVGSSSDWGDNYYKRASSIRITAAILPTESGPKMCPVACRGIYAKSVLEAWEYNGPGEEMTLLWRFDSDDYPDEPYGGQGCHSLSVGDVDSDGYDEIVYGAMTVNSDGTGLYTTGLGHGDMLHLGDFDPDRSGLEVYQCYETGTTRSSLRSALTGENYIAFDSETSGDEGRAMIADIDPDSPGCEMWMFDQIVYSSVDGSAVDGSRAGSCNFGIWFSGSANRQPMNGTTIDQYGGSRVFTLYRYNVTDINSSKKNPCFYGDIFGDWREEVILPTSDKLELRIFSTWYPTEYKVPYLMSDHIYKMSAMNQQVGYNQPTHLGYYFGSDNADDSFKPATVR